MKIYKIEQWSLGYDTSNPYLAPELRKRRLSGICKERAIELDGDCSESTLTTSSIVSYEDNVVTTRSGTKYELGEPAEDYVKWCEENGYSDPREGLKVIN